VAELALVGAAGQVKHGEAVIDTGFNGFLSLPPAVTALLGLPLADNETVVLADGSQVSLAVYQGHDRLGSRTP
jgi:predicted aspartyl protease